jgi:hypothetical protein
MTATTDWVHSPELQHFGSSRAGEAGEGGAGGGARAVGAGAAPRARGGSTGLRADAVVVVVLQVGGAGQARRAAVAGLAEADGHPGGVVGEGAVSGDRDVPGLLARLGGQQWEVRTRDSADRRVVTARITTEGKRLLARAEPAVFDRHALQFDLFHPSSRSFGAH